MSSIDLIQFKGEMPRIDPKKLPVGTAVSARNCSLSSGSLEAAKGLGVPVNTFLTVDNATLSKHPYTKEYLAFGEDVDLLRGPIANDLWDRVYWTDGIYPKYSTSENPSSSYRLGLPPPTIAPVAASAGGEVPVGSIEVNCSYIYTYVTKYGEESLPSPASEIVLRWDGHGTGISSLPGVPPSGAYNVDRIRLYRTEGYGTFNFVAELGINVTDFTDSILSESLAAPCPSLEWSQPELNLIGLTDMGNGMLAGFFGSTLCFSEPYYPHAWPVGYQLAFKENIVGIAMGSNGLIVTTDAEPWVVSGSHPSGMYQQKIDQPLACVSKGSIVDMGTYVMYASTDGIVAAAGAEAKLISTDVIGASDFQLLSPQSWKAYRYDDRYFAIANGFCLSFSPSEGFKYYDVDVKAGYLDSKSGELFVLNSDKTVCQWGAGQNLSFIWKSGVMTLPPRISLSCGRVDAEGVVTLKVFMDGIEVQTVLVNSDDMFRLVARRFRELQIQVEGVNTVHSISLAQSPGALK